jgi:chromosome segregation ATPase
LRLKDEIASLDGALENVLQLRGVRYRYRDPEVYGSRPQIGVIAQEVERVYPELVHTDERTGLKAVAYDHLVAPLIEALKSLQTMVYRFHRDQEALDLELSLKADRGRVEVLDSEVTSRNQRLVQLEAERAQRERRISDLKSRLKRLERSISSK